MRHPPPAGGRLSENFTMTYDAPTPLYFQFLEGPRSPRRPPYALLVYPMARRGGLRGAGGSSAESSITVNMERGFCPKNRSAAVVPSGRVSRKLWTAVRHARFLRWSRPRSWWFRSERDPLRPSTLELERWNTSASVAAFALSWVCSTGLNASNAPPDANSGVRRRSASSRSGLPWVTVRVEATRSR